MTLQLPAPRRIPIPAGPIGTATIRQLLGHSAKGLREFNVIPTAGKCSLSKSKSYPYKGQWKTWAKWTNDAFITSYATVSDLMVTLHHAVHGVKTIKAPSGMQWAVDSMGLKLVRRDGMEYHPTLDDLWRNKTFSAKVRGEMTRNYKLRKEQARKAKDDKRLLAAFQRDMATTRVSIRDSMRAGNCAEGTLRFAETKLKLDRSEIVSAGYLFHVGAKTLLRVANGEKAAVERAIWAAWKRETLVQI